MGDMMTFPASVEEFMEQYKMTDTEHVYSNGTEYVPIYRMKQWFEHCRNQQSPTIDAVPVVRCKDCKHCNISLVLPTGRKMYNCMEGSHDHQTLLKSNDFCSRGERRKEYE